MTSAHDALYVGAARDGEAALGPPPCPYALLVLGSGARRESTLRTDQDHALVVADDAPPEADNWFAALAEHLAATLEQCGLVRCPGDIMATNPARRVPLGAWQEQFIRWIEEPEEDAVLAAATYFDFRQLHGELEAEAPLRRVIGQAAGNRRFLGRLAVAALWRRPPLGFLHHLRGDHQGRIDLKAHGTAPIVDLARLLALEVGSPEVATTARLKAAAEHGTAGTAAADLAAAFEYLQQLRLRHQAEPTGGRSGPGRRRRPGRAHHPPAPLAQGHRAAHPHLPGERPDRLPDRPHRLSLPKVALGLRVADQGVPVLPGTA